MQLMDWNRELGDTRTHSTSQHKWGETKHTQISENKIHESVMKKQSRCAIVQLQPCVYTNSLSDNKNLEKSNLNSHLKSVVPKQRGYAKPKEP